MLFHNIKSSYDRKKVACTGRKSTNKKKCTNLNNLSVLQKKTMTPKNKCRRKMQLS